MSIGDRSVFRAEDLAVWMERVLEELAMPNADARLAARIMIDADLRGIDTHGIANFVSHWHYAPGLGDGSVNPDPAIDLLRESSVTAAWGADRGFGPVVAHRAMEDAIARADRHGVGTVTVRDGCHFGAAGYYARMAADRGLLGMVMSHTAPSAMPPGAKVPIIGTNPVAFAAPVAGGAPIVFDMAVTAAAGTEVQRAREEGRQLPPGWIVDAEGIPTTDPLKSAGLMLLGAGADGGGHKGYGLGLMVDIFSGLLSGTGSGLFAAFGPEWRIGSWFTAWKIEAFVDREQFDRDLQRMLSFIHAASTPDGALAVPGERSQARFEERARLGISLSATVVDKCRALAARIGPQFPRALGAGDPLRNA